MLYNWFKSNNERGWKVSVKKTGARDNNSNMEDLIMSKKARAKKVEAVHTEIDEKSVMKNWISAFAGTKSSASRCVTFGLLEKGGKTIAEL